MTKLYTFDMVLKAAVTVEGDSRDEALRIIEGVIGDCATARIYEGQPDDPEDELTVEVSLAQTPTLSLIDGVDVDPGEDADDDDPDYDDQGNLLPGCGHGA